MTSPRPRTSIDKSRAMAIEYLKEGNGITETAMLMGVDQAYIGRITRQWRKDNDYKPRPPGKKPEPIRESVTYPNARSPIGQWFVESLAVIKGMDLQ